MKRYLVRFAAVLLCLCLLAGCSGKSPFTTVTELHMGEKVAAVTHYNHSAGGTELVLPELVEGIPVRIAGNGRDPVATVIYTLDTGSVTLIRAEAFADCQNLRDITLRSVAEIESSAFERCHGLEKVVLPATVLRVGDMAFGRCEGLKDVYFLGEPEAVSPTAFPKGVVIHGLPGGSVEAYAKAGGFAFQPLTPEEIQ